MKKLTTEMQEVITELDKLHLEPIESLEPQAARQQSEVKDAVLSVINNHATKRIMGVIEPVAKVEHLTIPGKGGEIMLRIYSADDEILLKPVVLYFHGGGMVFANLNTYDSSCRAICNAAQAIIVSVAYRQAPENPFPAAPEDALTAYEWLLNNASSIGADANKIAVMGESAGGNLATGVCLQALKHGLPQPVHQVLVYPMVGSGTNTASYQENENAKPLNKAMMEWFLKHYVGSPEKVLQDYQWLAFPIKATSFQGLAPATVILAEIDPLMSEGQQYADLLQEAGVEVTCELFEGVTHEFFGMGAVLSEAASAVKLVAAQLMYAFEYAPSSDIKKGDNSISMEV